MNGGVCNTDVSKPLCTCPANYLGDNCQTAACPASHCLNGGTCYLSALGEPQCSCPSGVTGKRCDSTRCAGGCWNNKINPNCCKRIISLTLVHQMPPLLNNINIFDLTHFRWPNHVFSASLFCFSEAQQISMQFEKNKKEKWLQTF